MELWSFIDEILESEKEKITSSNVQELEGIPSESDLSLEVGRWCKVRNVVSLYIDMKGSTQLTNEQSIKTSAKMYQLFTGSLIRILKEFEAQFIDIKGDGGFGLWKERFGSVKAFLAAVTFKTFVSKHLKSFVKNQITDWEISSKTGITKGNVLVKRVGTRNVGDNKYNWAVWAGKPVNTSARLSDIAQEDTVLVTDDIFRDLSIPRELYDYLILSCGCKGGEYTGNKASLWDEKPEFESEFSIKIREFKSQWCDNPQFTPTHGEEYINKVLEIVKQE